MKLAFYDMDGTLVSTNVVNQYVYLVSRLPQRRQRLSRFAKLAVLAPWLGWLELHSREKFNVAFYRLYRGFHRAWLQQWAPGLWEEVFRPAVFPGAYELIRADRVEGYLTVLLTGSPDFAVEPLAAYLGFDRVLANNLVFNGGIATGELQPPVLAGEAKAEAIRQLIDQYGADARCCRAYSDSWSDRPMLEAVGQPVAVNPDWRLRRWARKRGWPVVDLR